MKLKTFLIRNFVKYPTHINLNWMWTFGSLLCFLLALQILTGFFLASYYQPSATSALNSINFIIKEVEGGWLIYRLHVLISTMIFIALYLHIYRGIYYRLYTWENRFHWWSGYILFLLTMIISFLGYILPWGQMSFWAATVIVNMVTIIPFIGKWLTLFIWGGNSVNTFTLQRFFVLHYILPFILVLGIILHIYIIHSNKSTANLKQRQNLHRLTFSVKLTDTLFCDLYPLFFIKDFCLIIDFIFITILFLVYCPEYFTNYINWVVANPSLTPSHIVPEWYFLPFYGIIKLIPHKVGGILTMVFIIILPFFLPFFNYKK